MRKLVESTLVALSGDIGAPHVWGPAFIDDEFREYANRLLFAADALLLGRVTYEGFAAAYPKLSGDFAARMNSLPKYVASTTLHETTWNATLIQGDVAQQVAALKQQPGQNILKYGTGPLDRLLMQHHLVDEFHFWLFPLVVQSAQRLFADVDSPTPLKLVETTTFQSGIVVLTYTPGP